jgi:pSer/pThr/pTyr-binding forkhead associated (FHA) protein
MKRCPQCQRENEDHFNFCLGCGATLGAPVAPKAETSADTCPSCGSAVPRTHAFCGACGHRMERGQLAPASLPAVDAPSEPPTAGAGARLVLINPDGTTGDELPLRFGENAVGRASGPQVFRDDPYLSPRHAAFLVERGAVEVRDLDSLNGVFYRIVESTEIRHGDALRIGRQLLRFELLSEIRDGRSEAPDGTRYLGSPIGAVWGRLVRVSSPTVSSFVYLLSGPEIVIGRDRGTVVFRDDGFVSGRHARLTAEGGRYFIEDLRSSNGTFLRVRKRRNLTDGELLLLGQQPLRVFLGT